MYVPRGPQGGVTSSSSPTTPLPQSNGHLPNVNHRDGGYARVATNPTAFAYTFGSMRSGAAGRGPAGPSANSNTIFLTQQQQLQQRQEEQRALSDKFKTFEKGVAKVKLMWAEVLNVCPEASTLAAAGTLSSKSLTSLRGEAEYYSAVAVVEAAAADSALQPNHRWQEGEANASHHYVAAAPTDSVIPSHPLTSADSYDSVREVLQRWVYRVGGIGVRNPMAHLDYVQGRTPSGRNEGSADQTVTIAISEAGVHEQQPATNSTRHRAGHMTAETANASASQSSFYSHCDFLNLPIGRDPSVGQMSFIQEETRRLQRLKEARLAIDEAVAVREGFVFYLQRLLADYTAIEGVAAQMAASAEGLNDDRSPAAAAPFLQIESEWRAGVEALVQQIEVQVKFLESGGDPTAAFGHAFTEELRHRIASDEVANQQHQQQLAANNDPRLVAQSGRQRLMPRMAATSLNGKALGKAQQQLAANPSEHLLESSAAALLGSAVGQTFAPPSSLSGSAMQLTSMLFMSLPPILGGSGDDNDEGDGEEGRGVALLVASLYGGTTTGRAKTQQAAANLRAVREQLGALLVARPPIAFGTLSGTEGTASASTAIIAFQAPSIIIGGGVNPSALDASSPNALGSGPNAKANSKIVPNALRKALKGAILNMRRSSFDVVKAIEAWRQLMMEHPALREHNWNLYETARAHERRAKAMEEDFAKASQAQQQQQQGGLAMVQPAASTPIIVEVSPQASSDIPYNPLAPPPTPQEHYAVPIYFWRGSSYMAKMSSDLAFLETFLAPLQERGSLVGKLSKAVGTLVMRDLPTPLAAVPSANDQQAKPPSATPDALQIHPSNFALEFLRLRKAQSYILKQLQRQMPVGYYVREAVASALAEALDHCDINGNPFLNPSRKASSAGYTKASVGSPTAPSWSQLPSEGSATGGLTQSDTMLVMKHIGSNQQGTGTGGEDGYANLSSFYMGTSAATNQQAIGSLLSSPLMTFFSHQQKDAIVGKWVERWVAEARKGGIGGPNANTSATSLIDRSNGLPSTVSKGLPDILKFNTSTAVRSYFNDNSDARKDVRPETYQWAEGALLGELLALGRQLSMTADQRAMSATCLQQQIDDSFGPIPPGRDQSILRCHQFDRLSRFNAVLRHKEVSQIERVQPVAEGDADGGAQVAAVVPNTTARGVYVRPETLAALEADCAGIMFNSDVCNIQYDMFSVFDPAAKPGNDAIDGPDDPDAARQVTLVLRRMGRNDPTLAAHLRIMASRKAALKAQNDRDALSKSKAKSVNGQDHNSNNNSQQQPSASKASSSSSLKVLSGRSSRANPSQPGGDSKQHPLLNASPAATLGLVAFGPSSVTSASLLSGKVGAGRTSAQIIRAAKKQFDRLELDEDRLAFASIVRIQALWRGKQGRRLTKALHALNTAARSIQSVQKCKEAKDTLRIRKLQHSSARQIQSLMRGVMARKRVSMMRHIISAAVTIQRYYRGHLGRRLAAQKRQIARSATDIQRVFRGHGDRKFVTHFKSDTVNHAATQIQRVWRGGNLRAMGTADVKQIAAATTIQTFWRRYQASREVQRQRQLNESATKIIALVRGGHARHTIIRTATEERAQAMARGIASAAAAHLASLADETFDLPDQSRYRQ